MVAAPGMANFMLRDPLVRLCLIVNGWPIRSSATGYRPFTGRKTNIEQFPVGLQAAWSVTTRSLSPEGPRWTVSTKASPIEFSESLPAFHLNCRSHCVIAVFIADCSVGGRVEILTLGCPGG